MKIAEAKSCDWGSGEVDDGVMKLIDSMCIDRVCNCIDHLLEYNISRAARC